MPSISIIVPVYKAERYLEKCVSSICAQTFRDFELLLVEDGSPDRSGLLCDALAENDARIRVIHKKNGGVSSARNCGLDLAQGKYIMFCDSDDAVYEDWCQLLYEAIEKSSTAMVVGGYASVAEDKVRQKVIPEPEPDTPMIWNLYQGRLLNSPWNKIYVRAVIEQHHLRFDETMRDGEDLYFVLQYLQKANYACQAIPNCLYQYRVDNADSLTSRFVPQMWEQKKKSYLLLKTVLEEASPDFQKISSEFYGCYLDGVMRVLNNTMLAGNPIPLLKKIQSNSQILRSQECKDALSKGVCHTVSPVYRTLLGLRTYWPVFLYGKLRKCLRKI